MRGSSAPRWVAAAACAAAVLAACTTGSGSEPAELPTPSQAPPSPSPSAPVPDCGDPRDSFPPSALPAGREFPARSHMADIVKRGRLIAGVSADTYRFGSQDPLTTQIEGFDIDVLKEVSRAIFGKDVKIEYRVISAADRIPVLQDGSVDIVARTMTMNCARWQQIAFSAEYYTAGQQVLVRSDDDAKSIADLDGREVCAPRGSTSLDRMAEYPDVEPVGATTHTECLVLFQQGTVDAITGDDTVLAGLAAQDPFARVVGDRFSSEPYGLGISQEHPEFVAFVNAVLDRMRADGTWTKIYNRWLAEWLGEAPPPPAPRYGREP